MSAAGEKDIGEPNGVRRGASERAVPARMPDDIGDSERRGEPRTETAFFAVEIRGHDLYYRLVRNISASGFSFDDRFPLEQPGDPILMEFPLPGSRDPIKISGRVVYARPDRGVGVHIDDVERDRYNRLMAVPPPTRLRSASK